MTLKTQRLLTRARKIANKGEIEEAEKLYSMILENSPENMEAKDELSALKHRKVQQEPPQVPCSGHHAQGKTLNARYAYHYVRQGQGGF